MKARVKETGATFHVLGVVSNTAEGYALDEVDLYCDESDNLVVGVSEDYWEKLKHQYAGMAMQSYVSNNVYLREIREMCKEPQEMRDLIADLSILLATTLVQKLKEKEERK